MAAVIRDASRIPDSFIVSTSLADPFSSVIDCCFLCRSLPSATQQDTHQTKRQIEASRPRPAIVAQLQTNRPMCVAGTAAIKIFAGMTIRTRITDWAYSGFMGMRDER